MVNFDERQLLVRDAELLLRQYERRNDRHGELSAEQRKARAAEIVQVTKALLQALKALAPENPAYFIDHTVAWSTAMKEGRRLATFKIRPGPPYDGWVTKDPPLKHDPTDPRCRGPRS